jgi:lysophospholipase L1-like esterase
MDAADRPIQRIAAIFGVLAVGSLAVGYGARAAWIARKVGRLADTPPVRGVDRGIGVTGVKVGHVALIGDSRIAQWPLELFSARWTVASHGVGGNTIGDTAGLFGRRVLIERPQIVVIAAGINDLVAASFLATDQREAVVNRVVEGLLAIARSGQDAGLCAVVTTVVPPALPSLIRRAVWKDSVRGLVMRVNDSLRERADDEGIVLFDAAAEVAGTTPRLGTAYSRDTLHFNRACYVRLTAQLEALLEDIRPASQHRRH